MRGKTKTKIGIGHGIFFVCAFIFGGLFLYLTSSIAKDHFTLQAMTAQAEELRDKNSLVRVQASQKQSLDNLELASSALDLVEVKHISYIEVKDTSALVLLNE